MEEPQADPLLSALPPATEYMTYLTILEYNVTGDNVALLNELLQDATLTANIGWDLVNLLLPLLPASRPCLETIARLGNPKEVVLKVTEALRFLELDGAEESERSDEGDENLQIHPSARKSHMEVNASDGIPLPALQSQILLRMLSVVHPRIKTKYPSRFLATSLQAVLAAFSRAHWPLEPLVDAIIAFLNSVFTSKMPPLPPRAPSSSSTSSGKASQPSPSSAETDLQNRLLQSFITHVTEVYVLSLCPKDEISSLGSSSRMFEMMQPDMLVPGRPSFSTKLETDKSLRQHLCVVEQLLSAAQRFGLSQQALLQAMVEESVPTSLQSGDEEDPPSSSEDIPLSPVGSLFLLVATTAISTVPLVMPVFPVVAELTNAFIGKEQAGGLNSAGTEPEAVTDAVISLSFTAIRNNDIGQPDDKDDFIRFLQKMSMISANSPSSTLRYHAHYLATTLLRAHPDDMVRLAFIQDTLEHCPYEKLKASAVGWVKGETLEINQPFRSQNGESVSVFATPAALQVLCPFLFPDYAQEWVSLDILEDWMSFKANLSFILASLNFYYLVLFAPHLRGALGILSLHEDKHLQVRYLDALKNTSKRFSQDLEGGRLAEEGEDGIQAAKMDLMLVDDALHRVGHALVHLND